jgi:hypothetical protein
MMWSLQMRIQQMLLGVLFSVGLVALAGKTLIHIDVPYQVADNDFFADCRRFYYVVLLAKDDGIWYCMADSFEWCSIEIYAGKHEPPST